MLSTTELFDREAEWTDLVNFARARSPGMAIGLVYGRRRQGKTFLLRRAVEALGGFYYQALPEARAPALEGLGSRIARHLGVPGGSLRFSGWRDALRALVGPGTALGSLVVLDEFPYLLDHSPELPAAIQEAYDESRSGKGPGTRLVLCGSAMAVMSRLLAGAQALRGRASLDLIVRPFSFRDARAFWGIGDRDLAFVMHAILGGTPGYRDLVDRSVPSSLRELPRWLGRNLLNPSHALFREGDYLLTEEPGITERGLYHSTLAAIGRGAKRPGQVAASLGRSEQSVRFVLRNLEAAGLVVRDEDLFRDRRPTLRVADPILRFYHVVVRPNVDRLEDRKWAAVWDDCAEPFAAHILGPHLEELARQWTARHAAPPTVAEAVGEVGSTVVNDPASRTSHQVDVVAIAAGPRRRRPRVALLGEAKASNAPLPVSELRRLERIRSLIDASGRADAGAARLALFARRGFARALREEAARRTDVVLVDLERLYEGS